MNYDVMIANYVKNQLLKPPHSINMSLIRPKIYDIFSCKKKNIFNELEIKQIYK